MKQSDRLGRLEYGNYCRFLGVNILRSFDRFLRVGRQSGEQIPLDLGSLILCFHWSGFQSDSSTFQASYVIKSTHVMLRHNLIGVINCHQIFVTKQNSL